MPLLPKPKTDPCVCVCQPYIILETHPSKWPLPSWTACKNPGRTEQDTQCDRTLNSKLGVFYTPSGSATSVVISGLSGHKVSLTRFATFHFIPLNSHMPFVTPGGSEPTPNELRPSAWMFVCFCISKPLAFMASFLCLLPSELTNQFQRFCFAWDPDGGEHTFTSHHPYLKLLINEDSIQTGLSKTGKLLHHITEKNNNRGDFRPTDVSLPSPLILPPHSTSISLF